MTITSWYRTLKTPRKKERKKPRKNPKTNHNLPDSHRLVHLGLATDTSFPRGRSTGASLALKDLPELQALIRRSRSQKLTVGAERAVQDTGLMGGDLDVANQGRVAPEAQ